jgi:hypothetical protein
MKKSQLKEAIKNEIKSVLSEDMNPKIYELRSRRVKATIDDLNQYLQNNVTASGLKSTLQDTIKFLDQFIFDDDLSESNNPTLEKIIVRFVKKYSKEWGLSMYDTFRGIQRKMDQMEDQFGEGKYNLNEEEMTDAEMEAKAEKSAKDKESKELADTKEKLAQLTKKMKSKAKDFKSAEGDAKEKIKAELKKMTVEKKKLEKDLK